MTGIEIKSRSIESILAVLGGLISLIASLYMIFGGFLSSVEVGLTVISILGSLLAFYGVIYIEKHKKDTIPLLIVATVMILFGFSPWNIFGALLVLIAAIYLVIKN